MKQLIAIALVGLGIFLLIWWVRRPIPCKPIARVADDGNWSMGVPMLTGRSEFAATVLADHLYVSGGLSYRVLKGFERFSFAEKRWERLANLPRPLHHMGLAALDGKVYMAGGYTNLSLNRPTGEAWIYNPSVDQWQSIAPMPATRAEHVLVAVGSKLYAVGGEGQHSDRLFIYDPVVDQWHISAVSMARRNHLSAVAYDGKIYALGGRQYGHGDLAMVQVYEPDLDQWSARSPMLLPRGGASGAVVQGKFHIVGGESLRRQGACTNVQHEAYNPVTDEWSIMPDMPFGKHGLAAVADGNKLYVLGGATRPNQLTVVSFTRSVFVYTQ